MKPFFKITKAKILRISLPLFIISLIRLMRVNQMFLYVKTHRRERNILGFFKKKCCKLSLSACQRGGGGIWLCVNPFLVEDPAQGHVLARQALLEQRSQPGPGLFLQKSESTASRLWRSDWLEHICSGFKKMLGYQLSQHHGRSEHSLLHSQPPVGLSESIVWVVWIQWIRFLPETWGLSLEQRVRGVGSQVFK